MKKFSRIILVLGFTGLLTACSQVDSLQAFDHRQAAYMMHEHLNSTPTKQMIALSLPNKQHWQRIDLSYGTVGSPLMLIPSNESLPHWTESIRTYIRDYGNHPDMNFENFTEQQASEAKKFCTHVSGRVLQQTAEYATYQLDLSDCLNEPNQTRFGKAMKGTDAMYAVYYSAATNVVSSEEIAKMSRVIARARLVKQVR